MSSYYRMIEAVFANPETNFAQFYWWAESGPTGEERMRLFPKGPMCEIMYASDQPKHGRADEWTKEKPWFIRVELSRKTWERWKKQHRAEA